MNYLSFNKGSTWEGEELKLGFARNVIGAESGGIFSLANCIV